MFQVVIEFENSEKEYTFTTFASAREFAELVQGRGYNSKMIGKTHLLPNKTMILTFPKKSFV